MMQTILESALVSCPDCGAAPAGFLGKLPDVEVFAGRRIDSPLPAAGLYACERCRLKFRSPTLLNEEYIALYDNGANDVWVLDSLRRDQEIVRDYIARNFAAGNILDFGCYTGGFLASIEGNFGKFGVEINEAAGNVARKISGVQVWSAIEEVPDDLKFDIIVSMDVIEHVASPGAFVSKLLSRLTSSGVIILTTGDAASVLWTLSNARWWYCYFPEHVAFISRHWLNYNQGVIGFSVVDFKTFNYTNAKLSKRIRSATSFFLYLTLPDFYRRLQRFRAKRSHCDIPQGVPGAGLTRDHLFAVLAKLH
jgi:2-polyprenyl-3-methyl-5-hydroxy-6-metoxy-1,4-benzoquinol methylase